jgi:hypothetical protein
MRLGRLTISGLLFFMGQVMKKKTKQHQENIALSDKFVPQFWNNEDGRLAIVKRITCRRVVVTIHRFTVFVEIPLLIP